MVRSPEYLKVGDVIRFLEGPVGPVECTNPKPGRKKCTLYGNCVFLPMWEEVANAITEVYDKNTFQSLVDRGRKMAKDYVPTYAI